MNMTAEYLAEQEYVIKGNTEYSKAGGQAERFNALRSFVQGHGRVLSIGSAGYDPILVGATHALDVHAVAERLLRANGWTGTFFLGDCCRLPWPDKSFPVGYCSEVLEHLPTWEDVVKSMDEIDRVCREWIVSFPVDQMHIKEHRRKITEDQVRMFCGKYGASSRAFMLSWYVWKGGREPVFKEVGVDDRIPGCVRRFIVR